MSKDRFSRFKKSNYDSNLRYGNNSMNYVGVGKREKLNTIQIEWIVELIRKISSESHKRFLRSVLADGKVPTQLQKNIILNISKSKQF